MRRSIVLFGISLGVAVAAACSSSSSNNSNSPDSGGQPDAAAPVGDSGLACGAASCATGEVCCYSRTSPTCTASAAACQGSYLSCSSTASCTGSQVCCFSFENDSGTGPFSAQCADSCNAPGYKLCASDSECSNGDSCIMPPGSYTHYCGTAFSFDASGFPGFDGNFPTFDASFFNRDTGTTPTGEASTGDAGTASETGADQ